jgi:hypothetical protein
MENNLYIDTVVCKSYATKKQKRVATVPKKLKKKIITGFQIRWKKESDSNYR